MTRKTPDKPRHGEVWRVRFEPGIPTQLFERAPVELGHPAIGRHVGRFEGRVDVHTQAEFCFDFITGFYPRSAVSCRIFLSAGQATGFFNNLNRSYQQYQQKLAGGQLPPPGKQ